MLPVYFSLSKSICQPQYRLATIERKHRWVVDMVMLSSHLNTRTIPATYQILEEHLPCILQSQCFNDDHLPFCEEVKTTEIGHLFEHILLEYLCKEKLCHGYTEADFCGQTSWNWKKETRGTFHITIEKHTEDAAFFESALRKSIELMDKILGSLPQEQIPELATSPVSELATTPSFAQGAWSASYLPKNN